MLKLLSIKDDAGQIEAIWKGLSDVSAHSYFQSWGWIENWITMVRDRADVRLAVVYVDESPAAAFFVGHRSIFRHFFVFSDALYLNETGDEVMDDLCTEYNTILRKPGVSIHLAEIAKLMGKDWDEFKLFQLDPGTWDFEIPSEQTDFAVQQEQLPKYIVDLEKVRQVGDYMMLLSSNTRTQIRRAYRMYEEAFGPVRLDIAKDKAEAHAIYRDLVALHQAHWVSRNQSGSFGSEFFDSFHRRLIDQRLEHGELQIAKVSSGDSTLGCFYNFVYRGQVYFYQSGITRQADNKFKPGMVCHSELVKFNAASGQDIYDFLGGEARYKKTLSTGHREVTTLLLQRRRFRFTLESRLRRLKQRFSGASEVHEESPA